MIADPRSGSEGRKLLFFAAMTKTALITGITGQDGAYLAEWLLGEDYTVHGIVRRSSSFNRHRIDHLYERERRSRRLVLHYGDLADSESLHGVLAAVVPDEVYNLAAQSHVGVSFKQPTFTGDITALGAVRMLEAVRRNAPDARYYQASSSELFGDVSESPQRESTPFHPRSPYAVAKLFAYWATVNYREAYGMFAANGILFNHESPLRGENFVTRKITMAVAEIERGRVDPLRLGNLNAERDWGFAGDYVRAMWLMLQRDTPADYVIGTGQTHSVRQFCELAFAEIGVTLVWEGAGVDEVGRDAATGRTLVTVDAQYFRPAEVEHLLADPTRAREELGWSPEVSFEELVRMMVAADQKNVSDRG
jgi:GDPmannose 4,6-dehydratase